MAPTYLSYCIEMALYRPAEYVPSRLAYVVMCLPKAVNVQELMGNG